MFWFHVGMKLNGCHGSLRGFKTTRADPDNWFQRFKKNVVAEWISNMIDKLTRQS